MNSLQRYRWTTLYLVMVSLAAVLLEIARGVS